MHFFLREFSSKETTTKASSRLCKVVYAGECKKEIPMITEDNCIPFPEITRMLFLGDILSQFCTLSKLNQEEQQQQKATLFAQF